MNIDELFTESFNENHAIVISEAIERKHLYILKAHLYLVTLKDDGVTKILSKHNINTEQLENEIWDFIEASGCIGDKSIESARAGARTTPYEKVIKDAVERCSKREDNSLTSSEDVLISLIRDDQMEGTDNVLNFVNFDFERVIDDLEESIKSDSKVRKTSRRKSLTLKRARSTDAESVRPELDESPKADTLTENISKKVGTNEIFKVIARDDELDQVAQTLSRLKQRNPILVGDSGVGKTAIVEGLAYQINTGNVPEFLKDCEIISINIGNLLSGTKYRGDFEKKLKSIIEEYQNNDKIILFIDEIHTAINAGATSSGTVDAGNILKPHLNDGSLRCIGATTFREYERVFKKDPALDRRFFKIDINPTPKDKTLEIVRKVAPIYENHHKITFPDKILTTIVDLSEKYLFSKASPSKDLGLLDDIGSSYSYKDDKGAEVTLERVYDILSKRTGMPVGDLTTNQAELLMKLEGALKGEILGQDECIDQVVETVMSSFMGLINDNKPNGSFLMVGPTGVGKTEIVKLISKSLNMNLIRLDMSEYMEKHSVAKIIGSPPGYVGYDEGGGLVDEVLQNPYSIILLDEVEKAHEKVFDLFLQILDDGHLTDSKKRKCSFENTIIFMTSNAGSSDFNRGTVGFGDGRSDSTQFSKEALKRQFRPEFLNRLDEIVYFNSLNEEVVTKIIDKNIKSVQENLKNKGVKIQFAASAKKILAKEGYDPINGARPLQRVINKKVLSQLSKLILKEGKSNIEKVKVVVEKEELKVEKVE